MLAPVLPAPAAGRCWRQGLPTLSAGGVTIRELRRTDAPGLLDLLAHPAVCQHIASAPSSLPQFARFVRWARAERRAGRYLCFGILPPDGRHAVGLLQLWPVDRRLDTVEWGFLLGHPYWGRGIFARAAGLFLDFAVDVLGVHRLEARAAIDNARGQTALHRLGATPEGVLRQCFRVRGEYRDHVLWSMLADDWRARRSASPSPGTAAPSRVIRSAQFGGVDG